MAWSMEHALLLQPASSGLQSVSPPGDHGSDQSVAVGLRSYAKELPVVLVLLPLTATSPARACNTSRSRHGKGTRWWARRVPSASKPLQGAAARTLALVRPIRQAACALRMLSGVFAHCAVH